MRASIFILTRLPLYYFPQTLLTCVRFFSWNEAAWLFLSRACDYIASTAKWTAQQPYKDVFIQCPFFQGISSGGKKTRMIIYFLHAAQTKKTWQLSSPVLTHDFDTYTEAEYETSIVPMEAMREKLPVLVDKLECLMSASEDCLRIMCKASYCGKHVSVTAFMVDPGKDVREVWTLERDMNGLNVTSTLSTLCAAHNRVHCRSVHLLPVPVHVVLTPDSDDDE